MRASFRSRDGLANGLLLPLYQALNLRGYDAEALLKRAGVEVEQLFKTHGRISHASSVQFWRLAEQVFEPRDQLALATMQQFNLRALGVLGMAWLASASLREALRCLVRYYELISSLALLSVQQEGDKNWLQYRASSDVLAVTHDCWLGTMVQLCRRTHPGSPAQQFQPLGLCVAHGGSAGIHVLSEQLGCSIQVGAAFTGIAFSVEQLDLPLPGGHAGLALSAEKILAQTRAQLHAGDVSSQVRAHLLDLLPSGDVSRAAVAKRMHLTERTLQRRLEAEQCSYAELLQQTRQELAQNLLRDPEHDVQDVAFLLGFAEISSFTRAFRRWTGEAPSSWRELSGESVAVDD